MLADQARRDDRPLPVIETDLATAHHLCDILTTEVVSPDMMFSREHPERAFGFICMYDGVKIKGKR
jgi:hypothetical protein